MKVIDGMSLLLLARAPELSYRYLVYLTVCEFIFLASVPGVAGSGIFLTRSG
jgi:hypothetical protein